MQGDDGPFDWNAPRHALPVDGARLSRQPTAPGLLERTGSASSFSSEGKSTYEIQDADLMAKLDADIALIRPFMKAVCAQAGSVQHRGVSRSSGVLIFFLG